MLLQAVVVILMEAESEKVGKLWTKAVFEWV